MLILARYTKALDSIKNLRKERMADLKAEKVHLQSLANEKGHSDKLKKRLESMRKIIAEKETDCEESKREYDAMVESNRKFYELYNKFREMYVKVEELERSKQDTLSTLRELRSKYREIPGTFFFVKGNYDILRFSEARYRSWRIASKGSMRLLERKRRKRPQSNVSLRI